MKVALKRNAICMSRNTHAHRRLYTCTHVACSSSVFTRTTQALLQASGAIKKHQHHHPHKTKSKGTGGPDSSSSAAATAKQQALPGPKAIAQAAQAASPGSSGLEKGNQTHHTASGGRSNSNSKVPAPAHDAVIDEFFEVRTYVHTYM